ncbi:hypothetical protein [Sphingobium indicum]|uniref:hypothetical protein n=1 Tax=Sphingobium indicum TaxID=332055 RepID=UPI000F65E5FF|nr:hypothetical protein [Sphingobium indicum]
MESNGATVTIDFTPLLNVVDVRSLVTSLLVVGAIMIVPRLAAMGIAWIREYVGGSSSSSGAGSYEVYDDSWDYFQDGKGYKFR